MSCLQERQFPSQLAAFEMCSILMFQHASDGDVSSPSSEALSPDDETLEHIPYMDVSGPAHLSSDDDAPPHARPPPLPHR